MVKKNCKPYFKIRLTIELRNVILTEAYKKGLVIIHNGGESDDDSNS